MLKILLEIKSKDFLQSVKKLIIQFRHNIFNAKVLNLRKI